MQVAIGISLIDRKLAKSWSSVTQLLADTINSVFAQTSSSYRLAIACNEIPDGSPFDDPRIEYVILPSVTPEELAAQPRADMWVKKTAMRRWAAHGDADYYFSLDADDLISPRLVEYIVSQPPCPGFLLRHGYVLDMRSGEFAALPGVDRPFDPFDAHCGSCVVVALKGATPAERMAGTYQVFAKGHHKAVERFPVVFGSPAIEIPFRAAIYRLYSGENFSIANGNSRATFWMQFTSPVARDEVHAEFALPVSSFTGTDGETAAASQAGSLIVTKL